jgi:HEAT repeat protein
LTRAPIVNRLSDKRWYFLRNLLIILSAQNDPTIVPLIRPLLRSGEPRLRHEVLKTLVQFSDPLAEQQVLEDLTSQNQELQTAALQLAERCSSPEIADKLCLMVSHGGFSQSECDRKSSIIHVLGEIGRAEVLPELVKILGSRSLLHSRQLTKLKGEIIRSLPKYRPEASRPVLELIADGSGEIARLAAETLRIISRKYT